MDIEKREYYVSFVQSNADDLYRLTDELISLANAGDDDASQLLDELYGGWE